MSKIYKIITLLSFQIGVNIIGLPVYYEVKWREVNGRYSATYNHKSKFHK